MNICLGAPPHFAEDLPVIGKLLGHTQVQTPARYAHLAETSRPKVGSHSDIPNHLTFNF